jgi:angiomotin like
MAYRKIERDYEQMLGQQERREELGRMAMKKLEKQLRTMATENEQLRAQINLVGFGQQSPEGGGDHHFMLELMPKNELLMVQMERQRLELEAQSATLEEQRRHIEVLEKALANAQERLAAKERSAVDAVAVVDKCTNLQK